MSTPISANVKPVSVPAKRKLALHWRVARILILAYLGSLGFIYFSQAGFIFPGATSQGKSAAQVSPKGNAELVSIQTAGGESIKALFGSALQPDGRPLENSAQRPTMLFFYGNAMCLAHARSQHSDLRRLGVNVLIPEYIGFGMSSGTASEKSCYDTADAAYAYLLSRNDVDATKIIAAGWSLGGAVAIDLASRKKVSGLAVFSTFTQMAAMGHETFPFFPTFIVSLILRHPFDNLRKIPEVSCPILIGHSRGDRIIPYFMSDQLSRAARVPPSRISIDNPDHDEFFSGGGAAVSKAILEFIEKINGSEKNGTQRTRERAALTNNKRAEIAFCDRPVSADTAWR